MRSGSLSEKRSTQFQIKRSGHVVCYINAKSTGMSKAVLTSSRISAWVLEAKLQTGRWIFVDEPATLQAARRV